MRALKHLVLAALAAFAPLAFAAPTVTLSVAPTSGVSPVTPVLTWSSTGAASCTASGGWSGTKATSGTETLPAITANASYTLTCTAASGEATLTWTPPTQRTDGTALTNLAQYGIWQGTSATALTKTATIAAGGTTHTITGLPAGTRYFAMTALDAAGLESAKTNTVSKPIILETATATASVAVTTAPPNPPGNLTVAVVLGMDHAPVYSVTGAGKLSTLMGFIPVGRACGSTVLLTYRGSQFREVARADVKFWGSTTLRVAAPCSA